MAIVYNSFEKLEGLAKADDRTLAVINDDDLGLSGVFETAPGRLGNNPNRSFSVLGLIRVQSGRRRSGA